MRQEHIVRNKVFLSIDQTRWILMLCHFVWIKVRPVVLNLGRDTVLM